jgi:hypothetical protein
MEILKGPSHRVSYDKITGTARGGYTAFEVSELFLMPMFREVILNADKRILIHFRRIRGPPLYQSRSHSQLMA